MINIPNKQTKKYKIKIYGKLNKTKYSLIKQSISITLDKEKIFNENLLIEIIICNEEKIKNLNKKYLNKTGATDIISIVNENNKEKILNTPIILGTIFLYPKLIKEKALQLNKDEMQHLIHLAIHGTLHLLGYNHEQKKDEIIMKNKEINILSSFGIISPY